jgi:hypothetical protein
MEGASIMSDVNSKNKIKSIRGLAKNKKNEPAIDSSNRRQIAITAFDLLNGEYIYTEKNRKIFTVILAVGVITLIFLGSKTVTSIITSNENTKKLIALSEEQRTAEMRFSQTSGIPDGITIKDLLSNFTSYENDFKFISNTTALPFDILSAIRSPDIFITSAYINIIKSEGKTEEGGEVAKKTVNSPPEELLKEIDFKEISEVGSVLVYYKITASASTALSLAEWAKRIRDSNTFNEMIIVSAGNIYTIHGVVVQDTPPEVIVNSWTQAGLPVKEEIQEEVVNE